MTKVRPSRPRPLTLRSLTAPARAHCEFSCNAYLMVVVF
ncbi:hypothetical protein LRHK_954 [Lacticaseibacillus rhamnosus ATCC 8530]|nr:hypothetical protein LRHK_954 [Lacticaseibacillus rhamnosus ATCC 8530]